MKDANYWIEQLGMEPHPEGTYFKENYRSLKNTGEGSLLTSVTILMKGGTKNNFHHLESDEVWFFHEGNSIDVHIIHLNGSYEKVSFGKNAEDGDLMQIAFPAGTIFGAIANETVDYCLFGCAVAPGFDFAKFHLCNEQKMLLKYPKFKKIISELCDS